MRIKWSCAAIMSQSHTDVLRIYGQNYYINGCNNLIIN